MSTNISKAAQQFKTEFVAKVRQDKDIVNITTKAIIRGLVAEACNKIIAAEGNHNVADSSISFIKLFNDAITPIIKNSRALKNDEERCEVSEYIADFSKEVMKEILQDEEGVVDYTEESFKWRHNLTNRSFSLATIQECAL